MGIRNKSSKRKHRFAAYLRRNLTWSEKILWSRLKDKKLGERFYSQSLVYGYVADFYCAACKLVVEVDGDSHAKQVAYDKIRDRVLWEKGIVTMRFSNQEVVNNTAAVVALIADKMKKRMK